MSAKSKKSFFSYLDIYEAYHRYSTDAPLRYGKLIGIQLLGHAMGYEPLHLIQPGAIRHNIYLTLIGESTISRKTTAQNLGRKVYDYTRILAEETSPEKLIELMSIKNEGITFLGEFSRLLKSIKAGGWLSGNAELYNVLYDCPESYTKALKENTFTIQNAYLSLNSTITPDVLRKYLNDEITVGGFLPRWLLVNDKPSPKPRKPLKPDVLLLKNDVKQLINDILRMDKEDVIFEFTEKALKCFNEIENQAYKYIFALPFAGRYLDYVIKIADILLVSDALGYENEHGDLNNCDNINNLEQLKDLKQSKQSKQLKIFSPPGRPSKVSNVSTVLNVSTVIECSELYVKQAWEIIEPLLAYANDLVTQTRLSKHIGKAYDYIKTNKSVVRSSVMRNKGISAKQMDEAEKTLLDMELIRVKKEVVQRQGTGEIWKKVYELSEKTEISEEIEENEEQNEPSVSYDEWSSE